MIKLWRLIKFAKNVLVAAKICRKDLDALGCWAVTGIGNSRKYNVRDGVVTEWKAYWAFRVFQRNVCRAMIKCRLAEEG